MALFSGEKPDRVPIFEYLCHDGVLEHFGGRQIAVGDREGVIRACGQCLDLCHPAPVPQEPGRVEYTDGTIEQRYRWHTSTLPGAMAEDGIRDMLVEEIEQAEAWRPAPGAAAAFRKDAEATDAVAGGMLYIHLGCGCSILPFGEIRLEQGIFAYADYPDLARRWNRAVNERRLREIEAVADGTLCPICIHWTDIACKQRLIYPPVLLEELFFPHLAAQVDLLHSRGVKVLYHSDGDVTEVLPRLVEIGIDGFNPLEIAAGMDAQTFREICGRRVALVGGIDAVDILARGTPELVAEETRRLMDLYRADGNLLIASASGQIDDSMPTENVLAMYETVWEYGDY